MNVAKLNIPTRKGIVVIRRTRGENGSSYTYCRETLFTAKPKTERKGKIMVNAKKETALFILNLISIGMTPEEIREDILMDRMEIRPEVTAYYQELAKARRNGTTEPIKPDFAELKRLALQAEKDKKAAKE